MVVGVSWKQRNELGTINGSRWPVPRVGWWSGMGSFRKFGEESVAFGMKGRLKRSEMGQV